MNHDYAHCLDFHKNRPKKCFRAKLVRDLERKKEYLIGVPISWAHFRKTEQCPKNKEVKNESKNID